MISQGKDRAALPNQIKYLKEKLRISEGLIEDMTKSWEQKLQDTKEIHEERQKALEEMGISLPVEGIGVQKDKSYLVNLNADPCMSELLVCYLKKKTRVGRPSVEGSSTPQQDIQLRGLGIAQEHCVFEIEDRDIFLTPFNTARYISTMSCYIEMLSIDTACVYCILGTSMYKYLRYFYVYLTSMYKYLMYFYAYLP